jgi:hypothetical protein
VSVPKGGPRQQPSPHLYPAKFGQSGQERRRIAAKELRRGGIERGEVIRELPGAAVGAGQGAAPIPPGEKNCSPPVDISNYSLAVGNSIIDTAWFTVPVAEKPARSRENVQYNIWTVNPAVDAPITAYSTADPSIPGSASRFG